MAPTLNVSYRPINIKWNSIKINTNKKTITFTTEFGHTITSKILNQVSVNQSVEYPERPEYSIGFGYTPLKVTNEKNVINFQEMKEILVKRNVIDSDYDFDDVMIGFVYSFDSDPINHTWMIQFRKTGNVIGVLNYLSMEVKNCPLQSISWHDEDPKGIWHMRFYVQKNDIKTILEYEPNKVRIIGKGIKKIISETSEEIPEDYERIRIRCDVKKNDWIIEFLKKESVTKSFIMKNIKCNTPMYGEALFDHPKPWVSSLILRKEVQNIQILDDLMVIQGNTPN